ncbi:putative helicase-like protein [Leptomonas seymouri]|uniref:Putative helicase-like protein n=1 Tax=Leptomonas seymouri TaxID=5684 RepID=A0A0N1PE28_LEPSE|nr:putative helicase-like protein [Leptomonas seymouri]|eukprot:KPI89991.1 putative helicase-like protein [Leptomonas seymouri]
MNLDNYFARFLQKNNWASVRHNEGAAPLQSFPVIPARSLAAAKTEDGADSNAHAYSDGEGRSDRTSGEASAVPTPPKAFLDGAGSSAVPAPHTTNRTAAAPEASKRPREEDEAVAIFSPTTARRVLARRGFSDEDEDELALLLGSQEARQVKKVDAMLEEVARVQQQAASASSYASSPVCAKENAFAASTACAVGSLAWHKASVRALETSARYFQRQFEFALHSSEELYSAFEPFFKDRALARIAQDEELRPVFHPAPTVGNDSVGALPGCVLRSYQVEGVQFLLTNFHRGMSCILADDMGLGKTAQISAFLHTLRQLHRIDGPHLIVAPLSTLTSWTRELARWAPQLRVVKYHGERQARMQARSGHHNRHAVFVTTPALIHHDKGFFRKRSWVTVIVDEAHVLKAHDTAITSVSRKLTACYRVAVTGTPVHNNVQEVWSLMSFLYPWLMAGYDPSVRDPVRQAEECAEVLQFIMLRRTKADMELGIPPRIDEPVTKLAPTYVQQHLLSQLTKHALQYSNTGHQLHGHLSHQRAVCNHPLTLRLLADEGRAAGTQDSVEDRMKAAGIPMDPAHIIHPSAKMRYLSTLLPKLKAEGHRCLIFSNFTATLDLLEAMCRLCNYSYERLDGSCNRVERELSMLRFNHPTSSCFLFLVTTTAGGVGVTLTGADTVVLFDAHFNPQLDRQAADRAHRIGQTRTVHVYRLCLEGTVEEHIRDIAARKASLGDFIVENGKGGQRRNGGGGGRPEDGAGAVRVTADDIREMFRRLEEQKAQSTAGEAVSAFSAVLHADHDGHAEDKAMIADLLRVEERGLPGSAAAATARRGGGGGTLSSPPRHTHVCFCCGDIMRPMEPLYHCMVCPKAYHATCIGERRPKPGETLKRQWTCPRHVCSLCSKPQAADGAIFMCDGCPRSYCFDCLDPRYLEMDPTGARLLHIRSTYADMAKEDMEPKRSCYYITCLRCCGVVSSSSSSSTGDDEEEAGESDSGELDSDGVESVESSEGAEAGMEGGSA